MKIIKKNNRAKFDYFLLETYSAGMILFGPEVKQAKAGHIEISESYVKLKDDGVYLWNAYIPAGEYADIVSDREKKLLLHDKEITQIGKSLKQKGLTVIPTAIGLEHGLVKVEIAVAKGKRKYDKRESIKKRDSERLLRTIYTDKSRNR